MIRRVWSSLTTFREVKLEAGMNIILADRAKESSDKESRNGLGKTTLLRIIHFCLGSDFSREKTLSHPLLKGVDFGIDLDIDGQPFSISRNTSSPSTVLVRGDVSKWPIGSEYLKKEGIAEIPVRDWTDVLGKLMFDAPLKEGGEGNHVSFRNLIGYFVRVGRAAFSDPFDHVGKQSARVKKAHTAFLLGLNWQQVQRWYGLEQQLDDARTLISAQQAFEKAGRTESVGDLEAQSVTLQHRLAAKEAAIASFKVRDDYHHIEQKLVDIDRSIHGLINANHADKRLRSFYAESLNEIDSGGRSSPAALLQQAGAVFQESALRHISEVTAFHAQVYRNRLEFLQAEIIRIDEAISRRDWQIDRLSASKSETLTILKTAGAIDTYLGLQQEHRQVVIELQQVVARIEERKRYEQQRDEIELERSSLRIEMRKDFEERQAACDKARSSFSKYTGKLYEAPGRLIIELDKSGPRFDYAINREGSNGIDQMVVFSYDLTLASLWQNETRQPGFLIHDSALFADVDARQKALAIRLAHEEAERLGFQYVCCLNSDTLPIEDMGEFAIDDFVRLRLSDEGPETRLLGIALPPHGTDSQ